MKLSYLWNIKVSFGAICDVLVDCILGESDLIRSLIESLMSKRHFPFSHILGVFLTDVCEFLIPSQRREIILFSKIICILQSLLSYEMCSVNITPIQNAVLTVCNDIFSITHLLNVLEIHRSFRIIREVYSLIDIFEVLFLLLS